MQRHRRPIGDGSGREADEGVRARIAQRDPAVSDLGRFGKQDRALGAAAGAEESRQRETKHTSLRLCSQERKT